MPLYTIRPFEARYATEDNYADIAAWAHMDIEAVKLGRYYEKDGLSYSNEEFNDLFMECPSAFEDEASPTP